MIQIFKRPIKVTNGDNPGTYYCAGFSRKGTADSIALAEQMKEGSSSFTRGEVVGVTLDLPARIKEALLAGQAVKINGLGTFKPSLTVSKIEADPDDLKASAVSIAGLNFKPETELLNALNEKAEYQWISADKASSEDKDGNDDDADADSGSSDDSGNSGGTTPSGTKDLETD